MSSLPLTHRIDAALGARSLLVAARGPGVPARRGGSVDSQTAPRGRTVFFRLNYSGHQGYVLLDLTELSSYLPLVPCFEFGNASGTLLPCTEGPSGRSCLVPPPGTPRAGAFPCRGRPERPPERTLERPQGLVPSRRAAGGLP